jgi:hypothetical protein
MISSARRFVCAFTFMQPLVRPAVSGAWDGTSSAIPAAFSFAIQ